MIRKSNLRCWALLLFMPIILSACSWFRGSLDRQTGFYKHLKQVEASIRQEDWSEAKKSYIEARKAWSKVKPFLQIDIDHDYVNDLQSNFVLLKGNLEAQNQANSLALILLIQDTWDSMGTL